MNINDSIQKIKGLCVVLVRSNRIILSYAKKLNSMNKSLTDLIGMLESGDLGVLDFINYDAIKEVLDLSTDAKYAVANALNEMEHIKGVVDDFTE